MFTYMDAAPWRPSLADLFEEYCEWLTRVWVTVCECVVCCVHMCEGEGGSEGLRRSSSRGTPRTSWGMGLEIQHYTSTGVTPLHQSHVCTQLATFICRAPPGRVPGGGAERHHIQARAVWSVPHIQVGYTLRYMKVGPLSVAQCGCALVCTHITLPG